MHASKLHDALVQLLQSSAWLDKRHRITLVGMVVGLIMSAKIKLSERVAFEESSELWMIASDTLTGLQTFEEYGLRFDIEENFLDDKSNGFQLERECE